MEARWARRRLDFKFLAVTSREKLRQKDTYYIKVSDPSMPSVYGIGEAGLFRGLSCDDRPGYEEKLDEVCRDIDRYRDDLELLSDWPSLRMGLETAFLDLKNGGRRIPFESAWTRGKGEIPINGLVWMGDKTLMAKRVEEKLEQGFKCVKLKIGGINFDEELSLLATLRDVAPDITVRLDANGAFTPENALERLNRLAQFEIHSIEQPIRQGQWEAMARICRESPIKIALDEELIGLNAIEPQRDMLERIRPQFIILKPTLVGGFAASDRWIGLAEEHGVGWWATSALESNIGLNAIAQWVATKHVTMYQGLGTGQLYTNNIPSPLTLRGEELSYNPLESWKIPDLDWH